MRAELVLRDVERLADHVEHVSEHAVAHRHRDASAEVLHRRAAAQAVGGLQADRPHAVVADLLRDLGGDEDGLALELGLHLERQVDLGQAVGRELDVDHRAGDRDDPANLALGHTGRVRGHGHGSSWVVVQLWDVRPTKRSASRPSIVSARRSSPRSGLGAQSFGAAHDLHDLGRDRVLTGAVHAAAEGGDEVVGVVGRGLHGALAGRVLRRGTVQQGRVDAGVDVARQQEIEDSLGRRLELVRPRVAPTGRCRRGRRSRRVRGASTSPASRPACRRSRNACRGSPPGRCRRRGTPRWRLPPTVTRVLVRRTIGETA